MTPVTAFGAPAPVLPTARAGGAALCCGARGGARLPAARRRRSRGTAPPPPTCTADGADGWRFGLTGGDDGDWLPLEDARSPLPYLPALPPAGVSEDARFASAAADVRFKDLADGAAVDAAAPPSVTSSAYEEDVRPLVVCTAGASLLYASVVQTIVERRRLWLRPLAVLVRDAPPAVGGDAGGGWAAEAATTTLHDVRGGADMLVDDGGWEAVDTVTRAIVTASLAARPRPFFGSYVEGAGQGGEEMAAEMALQEALRKLGQQM